MSSFRHGLLHSLPCVLRLCGLVSPGEEQLYLVTWENPRPDVEITSLDFVPAQQAAAPFLVAVALEP